MGKKVVKQKLSWDKTKRYLTAEYPTIGKKLVFDRLKANAEVRLDAECHGFKQGIGDSKSGEEPLAKFEMSKRRVAAWEGGSWTLQEREVSYEVAIEAIARVLKQTAEQVAIDLKAKYKDSDAIIERIKQLKLRDDVRLEILEVQRERAAIAADESEDDELVL